MAMTLGNDQQKEIMKHNYGKYGIWAKLKSNVCPTCAFRLYFNCNSFADGDCVAKVKQVYNDVRLPDVFDDYKKRTHSNAMHKIDQLLRSDETLQNACVHLCNQAIDEQ